MQMTGNGLLSPEMAALPEPARGSAPHKILRRSDDDFVPFLPRRFQRGHRGDPRCAPPRRRRRACGAHLNAMAGVTLSIRHYGRRGEEQAAHVGNLNRRWLRDFGTVGDFTSASKTMDVSWGVSSAATASRTTTSR